VFYAAPELDRALASSVTAGARQLVIDLSAATFVDSTALHVLLHAARQLDGKEDGVIVAAPDPNVRRVFGITGFDRLSASSTSAPSAARLQHAHDGDLVHQPRARGTRFELTLPRSD
jgi:anti-anti-sigma factor